MQKIIIPLFLIVFLAFPERVAASSQDTPDVSEYEQPIKKQKKKKRRLAPVTPGSQVIWLKESGLKAEIRPDKSVWWFGVNQKRAIMGDGVHELNDGQKITTKGGKLVSKPPKPKPEDPTSKAHKSAP